MAKAHQLGRRLIKVLQGIFEGRTYPEAKLQRLAQGLMSEQGRLGKPLGVDRRMALCFAATSMLEHLASPREGGDLVLAGIARHWADGTRYVARSKGQNGWGVWDRAAQVFLGDEAVAALSFGELLAARIEQQEMADDLRTVLAKPTGDVPDGIGVLGLDVMEPILKPFFEAKSVSPGEELPELGHHRYVPRGFTGSLAGGWGVFDRIRDRYLSDEEVIATPVDELMSETVVQ